MKSLGIAIKKGEIWYSFIEGTNKDVAIIRETGKQNYRPESTKLMLDFDNIFTELLAKFKPDVVSYKLSLDTTMKQIPYMHYSLGVLNLLCQQKDITLIERSSRWITANKSAKIQAFENKYPDCCYKNEKLASSVMAWYALGE
jgi:hypothetical protein